MTSERASRHIGIVACSAEGAALCYRTICAEGAARMGEHAHPEITMHTHPLALYKRRFEAGDWQGVAELMLSSASIVAAAGAEFAICPDNTIHEAYEMVERSSPIPWLHIARVVAAEAKRRGYTSLGILGTRFLMEGPVYPPALEEMGIGCEIPEPPARARIHEIIFGELVYGILKEPSRLFFNDVIAALRDCGCDAAVLGCTEIPLIVDPARCPLPTLDSTRLLARAALQEAMRSS
ncbi:MAG: amino acid racemase [Planctomycetes bacterium]|nr:amino acid racemase [Planctomycetota bacterium]